MKPSNFYWLLSIIVLSSCNRYFMPVATKDPNSETIKKYIDENKHLILREPSAVYEMRNVRMNEKADEIYCDLQKITGLRVVEGARNKKNYYFKPARPDSLVLNQVHLHTSRTFANDSDITATIPVSAIIMMEELKFDKRKTSRHNLTIALGVTAGVAAVAGIIATVSVLNELSEWGD